MASNFSSNAVLFPDPRREFPIAGFSPGADLEQAVSHAPMVVRAGVLGLMLSMTGLTFVKELAIFQVIQHGLWMHTYHFARDHYYECLYLSFALALAVTLLPRTVRPVRQPRRGSLHGLLVALWMVGGLNVLLFTANNGINLVRGKPLHCHHQGIGW